MVSGKLVLAGIGGFTINGIATINAGQLGLTGGVDLPAVQLPAVQMLAPGLICSWSERIKLPAGRGLVSDVVLQLRVYDAYPSFPVSEYTVTITCSIDG